MPSKPELDVSALERVGFDFLDFIGYFIPGTLFIGGLLVDIKMFGVAFIQSDSISESKSILDLSHSNGSYVFITSIALIAIAYIIGRLFGALRWGFVDWLSRRRHDGIGIETYLYIDKNKLAKDPETAKKEAEIEYLRTRNKCMTEHRDYYGLIFRWYSLAINLTSSAFACILLWVISFAMLIFQWPPQPLAIWWMAVLSIITALFVLVIINKSIDSHFYFMKYIKLCNELGKE